MNESSLLGGQICLGDELVNVLEEAIKRTTQGSDVLPALIGRPATPTGLPEISRAIVDPR